MHQRSAVDFPTWSAERYFPRFQAPERLTIVDVRRATVAHRLAITLLAGLVNRQQPQLYLLASEDDEFWLQAALSGLPQERLVLTGTELLEILCERYRQRIAGLVIVDPACPDSINVATTLAGLRDALVLTPELFEQLSAVLRGLPLIEDLRRYGWRKASEAYGWAAQQLFAAASRRTLAGMQPQVTGALRSLLVATRTFVHWLDTRPLPSRERQGERALLRRLLSALEPGSVHLGWFRDEGSGVALASQAAVAVLASDHCSNLEVWCSLPAALPSRRRALPGVTASERCVYVSFTISDGDNLQYAQHRLLHLWRDPARGRLPLGWTIGPALLEAAPALARYYWETASPLDEFIAGPSGAAYIFPSRWPVSALPSFLEHSRRLMTEMGLSLLEVLDASRAQQLGLPIPGAMRFRDRQRQAAFVAALQPAGLRGIFSGAGAFYNGYSLCDGLPIYHNLGLASSVPQLLALIRATAARRRQRPLFLNVYVMAWSMTPSDLLRALEELGDTYRPVTPGQLLQLIAQQ
jgi:hypothetical protein